MYVYVYAYVYIYMYIDTYVYIYGMLLGQYSACDVRAGAPLRKNLQPHKTKPKPRRCVTALVMSID